MKSKAPPGFITRRISASARGTSAIVQSVQVITTVSMLASSNGKVSAAASRRLVSYPNTQHAFIYGSYHYNPVAYADGMQRTAAELAEYLGRQ
jgi:hypothetical protein